MGLLHFHSEIPRIQASVKAEADESAEAAAAQYVELKFRWRICMYAQPVKDTFKVLFTQRYTWQKFGSRVLRLLNRHYAVINKNQNSAIFNIA